MTLRIPPTLPSLTADRSDPFAVVARDFAAVCRLSDEELDQVVADAELAPLLVTLAQLSGDASLLDPRLRPPLRPAASDDEVQGGMSPESQATARRVAREALGKLKANGGAVAGEPSRDELVRLMSFITGDGAEDYVPLLAQELGFPEQPSGEEAGSRPAAPAEATEFTVAVIGAGMSGLAAAYRLAEAGIPFVVIEKNCDVGGTWLENTYPGCRLDTSNFAYTYSFAPSAGWDQLYTVRDQIHGYFRAIAESPQILPNIRFNTEVIGAGFDEEAADWTLELRTEDGELETLKVNAVISAVGQLNRPAYPAIPGRERFAGSSWHSAQWDHETGLEGLRVAVVGTGASAYQIVPAIADSTASLKVFQRNPPWMLPTSKYHADVPAGMRWLLAEMPYFDRWVRFYQFWRAVEGRRHFVEVDPSWSEAGSVSRPNQELRETLIAHLAEQVGDRPDLLEKMIPSYPPGAKRMLRDNGVWAGALRRENVSLVTDPIAEIVPSGLVTADGTRHEVDVIIYATGFEASDFLAPMSIRGRGGIDLHEHWSGDPRAYLGITIPGFPNLFCLYGPNTALVVNGSAIFFSEAAVNYTIECLRLLQREGYGAMDCRLEPFREYNQRLDAANREMAWGVAGVDSWYKGRSGRVTQVWPHSLLEYWQVTRRPDPGDYELLPQPSEKGSKR